MTSKDTPSSELEVQVSKLYTDYWNSGITGQEFQAKVIALCQQEYLRGALDELKNIDKLDDPDKNLDEYDAVRAIEEYISKRIKEELSKGEPHAK